MMNRLGQALQRAFPILVIAALLALYTQLRESKADLEKMRSDLAQVTAVNAHLEQRIAYVSSQRLQPQTSPFGAPPAITLERNDMPIGLSPVERKEAIIEEQRANDRARFEFAREQADQRTVLLPAAPVNAANDAPRQGPLTDLLAKARRTP